MQQKSPKVQALSRRSSPAQAVIKLEAEIRRNQWRIGQLHTKNDKLNQQIIDIEQQHRPPHPNRTSQSVKSRQPPAKRPQLSKTWLSIGVLSLCLIVSCGVIGFAIARLFSVK